MNYLSLIDDPFLISKYTQGFYVLPLIYFAPPYIAEKIAFIMCKFNRVVRYFDLSLKHEGRGYCIIFKESGRHFTVYNSNSSLKKTFYISLSHCEICGGTYTRSCFYYVHPDWFYISCYCPQKK